MKNTFCRILVVFIISFQSIYSQAPTYIPSNGLIAFCPFNGNANDLSGNTNNGNFVGAANYTTDRFGASNSSFQGGSSYITFPSTVFRFARTDNFTVSLWFTKSTNSSGRMISTENPEGNFRISGYVNSNLSVQFGDYLDIGVNDNGWHNLIYTYENRNEKVYVDGVLVTTNYDTSNEVLNYGSPFTIGAKAASAFDKWNGKIDDVAIWNRVLTSQEINNLFNSCTTIAPVGNATQVFCSNSTPTVASLTATGAEIQWYTSVTGGSALASSTALVDGTTYYASQTISGCESNTRFAVTVDFNDPQIAVSATSVCSGTAVTLTASTTVSPSSNNSSLPSNLQNGLVGYWPFSGNANDVSGNGNNGTVNGATLTTDRFGNLSGAYSFDGVNDYIICNNNNIPTQTITISSWIYQESSFNNMEYICLGSSSSTRWGLIASNNNIVFNYGRGCSGSSGSILTTNQLNVGEWIHLVYVSSALNGMVDIYKNGIFIGQTGISAIGTCSTQNLYFGVDIFSLPEYIYGKLDDISIWDRALTQAEITQLYTTAPTYLWSTGETSATINPTPTATTTYWCDVTVNGVTCRKSITIIVNDPQITASATTVCNGTAVTLTASTTATPVANNCTIPTNLQTGLVGYWPFCGDANDTSGNGNNGTVNAATLTSDRFGNVNSAYYFNGIDSKITCNPLNGITNTITLSTWIKSENNTGEWNGLVTTQNNTQQGFLLQENQNNHYDFSVSNGSGYYDLFSNNSISNEWKLIVCIIEPNILKIYVNGILDDSIQIGAYNLSSTANLNFGSRYLNEFFKGSLDDIGIWNRALSPSEINQLYISAPIYLWSTGETTSTINTTPTATTTYWCDITVNGVTSRKEITITVNPIISPTFTQVASICSGTTLTALSETSNNSITGSWFPSLNNTVTTNYTFTPTSGQCATTATMTIEVNPTITPIFAQVAAICKGVSLSSLPTTSNNSITGTWSPVLNILDTTTYTFTPTPGQCSSASTMTITVNPIPNTPTGVLNQKFCSSDSPTLSSLLLNQSLINWYSSITSQTVLSLNTPLVDGETYYATQFSMNTDCQSIDRIAVKVDLNDVNTPSLKNQTFCLNDLKTIEDIDSNGENVLWYESSIGGEPLSNKSTLIDNQVLYVSGYDKMSNCESNVRQMFPINLIDCELSSNNLLTLNGNNLNDNLNIKNIEYFSDNHMQIFNRSGQLVWKTDKYNNTTNTFLGRANCSGVFEIDKNLPTGTYFYVLNYYNPFKLKFDVAKSFFYINNNN